MTKRLTNPVINSKTAQEWGKFALYEGCVMSRRMVGPRFTARFVLDKFGFNYEMLENEKCCGAPVMRSGGEDVSIECRIHNLEQVKKEGTDTVVTGCPGCGSQLKSEESEKMGIKVHHLIEIFYDLAKNGELYQKEYMRPIPKLKITAHYPCHMHRGMLIDAGKAHEAIVNAFPNLEFIELDEPARCCGAGGGVRASQKELSYKIRRSKLEDIKRSGADIVLIPCSFCELQIAEGLKTELVTGQKALMPQDLIAMFFKDIGEEVARL